MHADLAVALPIVRQLGRSAPLLALPAVLVLFFETLAWQLSIASLGRPPNLFRLASIRLATDSLLMSIPGGVVLSEAATPMLLRKCGLPIADAAAATAGRKWLGMKAHALYIFAAAVVGWQFLDRRSLAILGAPRALPWVVALSALLPLSAALFLEFTLSRGAMAAGIWKLLARLPSTRLRTWLGSQHDTFKATDGRLSELINQGRGRSVTSTLLFFAGWLCEALEAYVIARALGVSLGFSEIMAFEAGLSLVRSLVFFAPSGIGVQDLGYVAFFTSTGLPHGAALGGAFVIVKRMRELLWIVVGWFLLSARRSPSRSTTSP